MSYDISFRAKLDGTEQWVAVGDDWINHTANTATMIKAVCGSYPSDWDGMPTSKLLPALSEGIAELRAYGEKYKQYVPDNGWGTVQTTITFLETVRRNCEAFPTAVISVSY